MAAPKLGSILLASTDPARLHTWYATVLPPETDTTDEQYRILGYGEFHLFIDSRSDVGAQSPEPGRMIFNFEVDDAREVAARFDASGAPWLAPLEDRHGSLFGTVVDPDGNYVQIIQLSEEHRAAMAGSSATH
ncbi:MAG: VOC family protein [Jiangellaceae bacterium]